MERDSENLAAAEQLQIEGAPAYPGEPSLGDIGGKKKKKTKKHVSFAGADSQEEEVNDELFEEIRRKQAREQQKREQIALEHGQGDDDEEEDDDDFEPPSEEDEDDYLAATEDEDDQEDKDANEAAVSDSSWNGINSGRATPVVNPTATNAGGAVDTKSDSDSDSDSSSSSSDSDDSSSSSDSSSDDESDAPSEEGVRPAQHPPRQTQPSAYRSAPFEGKAGTKKRNERRRDSKKLKYLQSQGILPATATRAEFLAWKKNDPLMANDEEGDISREQANQSKTSRQVHPTYSSPSSSSSSDEEEAPKPKSQNKSKQQKKKTNTFSTEDFEQRRNALLAAIANGGIDVQSPYTSAPEPQSFDQAKAADMDMTDATTETASADPVSEPAKRKNKLDLAASQRLLFSSLGVRRPKNESDRQKLRATFATQGQRKPVVQPSVTPQPAQQQESEVAQQEEEDEESTDPNLWKRKINLSAIECVLEDVEYIRPPFPFKQRWDPQMRDKKRKRASSAYTANKSAKKNHEQDYYNDAEGGDALDYGDEGGAGDESYYDENGYYNDSYYQQGTEPQQEEARAGAVLENGDENIAAEQQLLQESTEAIPSVSAPDDGDDDLPPLPSSEELATLPSLTPASALPGAIITFTRLEVSAATNWAPSVGPVRVAQISALYDDGKVLELQLAKRDVPRKQYDSSGRRMFSGFEMDLEDDEEDGDNEGREGILEVDLADVMEGRVIKAAEVGSSEEMNEGSGAGNETIEEDGARKVLVVEETVDAIEA